MVVFAVDIIGNRAADGYKFRSRSDWQKPSVRDNQPQYFIQADSRLAAEQPSLHIKLQNVIQRPREQQRIFVIETTIAVATAQSIR
jgi:hypothetical protein